MWPKTYNIFQVQTYYYTAYHLKSFTTSQWIKQDLHPQQKKKKTYFTNKSFGENEILSSNQFFWNINFIA